MTVRPASTVADLHEIQRIAGAGWPRGWHPGGLGWALSRWLLDDEPSSEIVVFDAPDGGGRVGGWATRGQHSAGEVSVQVDRGCEALLGPLLDWALDGLDDVRVSVEVYDGDDALAGVLAGRGFAAAADEPIVGMVRVASGVPTLDLGGYHVRSVHDGEDEARIDVHRRAWKPAAQPWADGRDVDPDAESSFDRASYDAVRAAALYRQDLDLVAEAPDGSLAACCIVWFDSVSGTAEIEPMGVDPAHRRHGLAVALCHEACRRVADLGGTQVFLNVQPDPAYPANSQAYLKAGFEFVERGHWHARPPLAP